MGGGAGGGSVARASDFFTKNPNLKIIFWRVWEGGWLG